MLWLYSKCTQLLVIIGEAHIVSKLASIKQLFFTKVDNFPVEVPEKYFADYNDILGGKLDKTYFVGESISIPFTMH